MVRRRHDPCHLHRQLPRSITLVIFTSGFFCGVLSTSSTPGLCPFPRSSQEDHFRDIQVLLTSIKLCRNMSNNTLDGSSFCTASANSTRVSPAACGNLYGGSSSVRSTGTRSPTCKGRTITTHQSKSPLSETHDLLCWRHTAGPQPSNDARPVCHDCALQQESQLAIRSRREQHTRAALESEEPTPIHMHICTRKSVTRTRFPAPAPALSQWSPTCKSAQPPLGQLSA